ncbi:MAG: prepilin peptidase [Candidatus Hydrogenedentes bacterium]|nr:prepilin peptidase [Candidatus Hydrogenedentota bacterium]
MSWPFQTEDTTALMQWGVAVGASLLGALSDLRTRRIPNRLTTTVLVTGCVSSFFVGGFGAVLGSMVAAVVVAFPFVLLWALAGGGAGDAKLMGALGAWLGVKNGIIALICVVLFGALLGLLTAWRKGQLVPTLTRIYHLTAARFPVFTWLSVILRWSPGRAEPGDDKMLAMPYGVAIFCGVCSAAVGSFLWPR